MVLTSQQRTDLQSVLTADRIYFNQPLKDYTSFKVGGPADILVLPETDAELKGLLSFCSTHSLPWFVLGKGTNLVVLDKGFRGMVIRMSGELSRVEVKDQTLTAGGGALLSDVAARAALSGLTGMEFAQGIPGTVGGAVMMNAGAYGGEMKDIVTAVHGIREDGSFWLCGKEEMQFGYRICALQGTAAIVTRVELALSSDDPQAIRTRTEELQRRRWDKQPLDLPSAGSVFRRPEGHYAGALIEKAGLKGFQIGGAQVSEKHAGFIVNTGQATAADIMALIAHIQKTVFEQSGVRLKTEVKIIGEE